MPLFINRDQIFAHQVHLLEHKLRSKEERILELETENALLHLRLAECLGRLRWVHEGQRETQRQSQLQRTVQKSVHLALGKLLSQVQVLKQDLREVFGVYRSFAQELEAQSGELLDRMAVITSMVQGQHGHHMQKMQVQASALERSLEEEKERCRTERQRRRLLHNALVVSAASALTFHLWPLDSGCHGDV
ncbi:kinesin-like protein KIF25 [Clupea harengus]|uniref:Kinesin-like protein KIF25 n=1 Tax=Clupea harengus TaxID=7950 RepID=A0A6P8GD78_CLUHA|nr:kinesin-like protein KIF25 [Clupea harengus]